MQEKKVLSMIDCIKSKCLSTFVFNISFCRTKDGFSLSCLYYLPQFFRASSMSSTYWPRDVKKVKKNAVFKSDFE